MVLLTFGIISAVLYFIGDGAYIVDTLKGTTHPHRVSWGIFMIMNIIDLLNQSAAGAAQSLWILAAALITTTSVFILSIPRGTGGAEKLDWLVLGGALIGLILWGILRTPMASIICNLAVTTMVMVPILKKSFITPHSETSLAWLLCGLASLFSGLAVGSWNLVLLLLPIHGFILQIAVYLVLIIRQRSVPIPLQIQAKRDAPAIL